MPLNFQYMILDGVSNKLKIVPELIMAPPRWLGIQSMTNQKVTHVRAQGPLDHENANICTICLITQVSYIYAISLLFYLFFKCEH
uniref:Uncharacterized protein n=1 Tax=Rhizophora mucronata TaxID=61149 RepID=A0A2P2PCV1_RHIMU